MTTPLLPDDESEIDAILRSAQLGHWDTLADQLVTPLADSATDGALQGLADVGADVPDAFALVNDDALDFAQDRAAELVGRHRAGETLALVDSPAPWAITETTRLGLRRLVAQALDAGWSPQELQAAIQDSTLFSATRAETIARTELALAHTTGNVVGWRRSGLVRGKKSLMSNLHDHDDICDVNAEAGVIPLDASFPSGDDGPPYHPNCECVVVPDVVEDGTTKARRAQRAPRWLPAPTFDPLEELTV